jgi:hypothetical protein
VDPDAVRGEHQLPGFGRVVPDRLIWTVGRRSPGCRSAASVRRGHRTSRPNLG